MRKAAPAIVITTVLCTSSAASGSDSSAGAHVRFQAQYLRMTGAGEQPYRDRTIGGLHMRGFYGLEHVKYAAAIDFELGATAPAGFFYHQHVRPVGFALSDGALRLSMTGGVGVDGVTGILPPATRIPVDMLAELPLHDLVKLEVAAEMAWLPADEARQDGARLVSVADESALSLRVRFDRRFDTKRRIARNGVDIALELRERHRQLLIGASLGFSLDGTYGF
jgi:hypothetical protein